MFHLKVSENINVDDGTVIFVSPVEAESSDFSVTLAKHLSTLEYRAQTSPTINSSCLVDPTTRLLHITSTPHSRTISFVALVSHVEYATPPQKYSIAAYFEHSDTSICVLYSSNTEATEATNHNASCHIPANTEAIIRIYYTNQTDPTQVANIVLHGLARF